MALDTVWSAAADTTAYPRPQMIRGSYVNLDGLWDYKIVKGEYFPKDGTEYDGKIRVPFALESPLSGVGRTLGADESLVLRTVFDGRADDKFVLHIGAADFFCIVYLNGKELTRHTGGYTSFSAEAVAEEKNELICVVRDPSDQGVGARGKQRRKNGLWGSMQPNLLTRLPPAAIHARHLQPQLLEDRLHGKRNLKRKAGLRDPAAFSSGRTFHNNKSA